MAKKKGWLINEIKWTENNGTFFDEQPNDLREKIEKCLSESNIENLGNPIRRYLEHALKEVAVSIEAKLSFQYNDSNEHRMPYELIMGIKSEIKKCSTDLKSKFPVIDRIESSSILGNICSHDNPFNPKIGDLKAFWSDILELENIFICQELECKRPRVSLKNYDTVAKKIRCGCDHTKYDWKK
ncbi:MAG TPA: hypothetical protein DCG77_13825 [Sphingobacterium sp.]|nr:hypothetical protein [Sphingobacterium sp.]